MSIAGLVFDISVVSFIVKWRLVQADKARSKGDFGKAEELLHRVLADLSANGEARINVLDRLANVYYESGQWSNAVDCFKDVIKGFLLHGRSEYDDAVVEVALPLPALSKRAQISLKIAQCFRRMGRLEESFLGHRWCVETVKKKVPSLIL